MRDPRLFSKLRTDLADGFAGGTSARHPDGQLVGTLAQPTERP
ncbi:hypothetical protein [Herbiconiux sp.]|nr:hypothetical protein [Herbiconiux sp.]